MGKMGGKGKTTRLLITSSSLTSLLIQELSTRVLLPSCGPTNTRYDGMNQGQKQQQDLVKVLSFRSKWDLLGFSGLYYATEANQMQLLGARNKDSKSVMKMWMTLIYWIERCK